jgi:hypothetical protein
VHRVKVDKDRYHFQVKVYLPAMDYLQTRGKIKTEHKETEAIAIVKLKAKREILLLDEVTVPMENS